MSIPLPSQYNTVLHDWDEEDLPELTSVLSTITLPRPGRIASHTTSPPADAPCSFPSSVSNVEQPVARAGMSAADARHQDLVLALVAKLKKTMSLSDTSRRGMDWVLPYFVSTCLSRCFSNATFHDNSWIALHQDLAHHCAPDFAHLVEDYVRVALVVTLPISHISQVDQPPELPGSEGSKSESEESGQPYDTLSEMLAQEIYVKEIILRYDWKDIAVAPKHPAMHRVIFAAHSPVPALCVVVVAERDQIGHAMLSGLYHRLAWGVRTPLLGLSFSHDSSLVKLHVGWLDDATGSPDDMPRAHFLGSWTSPPQHRTGRGSDLSFSLDDPNDALVLARILLSLQQHMEDDCQAAQLVHQNAIVHWRADQVTVPEDTTHAWSHETISNWSRSIVSEDDPNTLPVPNNDDDGPIPARSQPYSFDQFVALKERRGITPTAVALWLLDRFVVSLPLPPIATSYTLKTRFTRLNDRFQRQIPMFNLYRSATCFKWPRAWQNLDNMPLLPHTQSGMKRQLCRAIQSDGSQPPTCAVRALLTHEASLILEHELGSVLQVCALAQSLKNASSAQTYSYCYDMLFSILPICDAVQLLPSVTIQLSRSVCLDEIAKGSTNSVLYDVHDIYSQYYAMQTAETQLFKDKDDRYYPLREALQRFGNDTSDWPVSWNMGRQRVLQAPTSGTCDAAVAARFYFGRRLDTQEIPTPAIIIGQSQGYTCPAFPLPYWSSTEFFSSYNTMQRILTYDIMATAHQDYPGTPLSHADLDSQEAGCNYPAVEVSANDSPKSSKSRPQGEHVLDVPVLFVVHSAQRVRFHIADSNRLRMCLTSAVRFLASLQILDFPLFGLLTEGTVCAVVMAWCTRFGEEEPFVHLVDLNCASYDISVAAGALNFATFLLWIHYEHVPQLLARLEEADARGDLTTKHGAADGGSTWSAEDQLGQLSRGEPPFDQVDQQTAEDQPTSEDSE